MMDFTVIMRVRHQFGDDRRDPNNEILPDHEAPFVGQSEDFPFLCPSVDPSEEAVLQFEHRGATFFDDHPVSINGVKLFGGVSAGPRPSVGPFTMPSWVTRSLIVQKDVLKVENIIRFETKVNSFTGNLDNFTIDNVVIFYKTRDRPGLIAGAAK